VVLRSVVFKICGKLHFKIIKQKKGLPPAAPL
jgi:hypothetical protein